MSSNHSIAASRVRRKRRRPLRAPGRDAGRDSRCTYGAGEHGGSSTSSQAAASARGAARGPTAAGRASARPQRCSAGRLGNTANNSSRNHDEAAGKRSAARRRRYELRRELWELTGLQRVACCGRTARTPGGQVGLRVSGDGRAGFSGVTSCGSVWACPVCAAKIAAERATDLGRVGAWAVEQGHTMSLLTMTVQHHAGMRLADCWDAVTGAWSDVVNGEAWSGESERAYLRRLEKWEADRANGWKGSRKRKRPVRRVGLAEKFGVLGWARAVEVLHGSNGWHPHVHVPLILDGPASDEWIRLLGEAMFDRFQRALRRRGYDAIRDSGGLDIRRAYAADELGGYLAKQLAFEATHGHVKTGRSGSDLRAPFQVVADLTATGDADDLAIWQEWEQASKGRQQLTWSGGIRALAGLATEQRSDEEIADDELGDDDVLILDRDTWRAVAPVQLDLLTAAAEGGVTGAIIWLDQTGLTYTITSAGRAELDRRPVDASARIYRRQRLSTSPRRR